MGLSEIESVGEISTNTFAAPALAQTKDGQKMGKSLGNVLEPRALLAAYGPDAVRFYFLKEVVFGQVRQCTISAPLSSSHPL